MATVRLADRVFLIADSTNTPQHVACLATFEVPDGAPVDFVADLAARMRAVTTVAQPFNYRLRRPKLKAILPSWRVLLDEEVDLDYHFRHSALPRPGSERELGVLVSRLHSLPLDPARPLWELHLIEGLADGRFAIYFKIHHALMDGIGGVRRFEDMVSKDPEDLGARPLWSIGPRRRVRGNRPGRGLGARVRSAAISARAFGRTFAVLARSAGQMVIDARRPHDAALAVPFVAPPVAMNGRIGRQRRVATQTYDLARLRAVADAAGVTINDVFLAIVGGGLRRYLSESGELPDGDLTAGTPVNIRAEGDSETTNAFTMTVMRLGTSVADPVERLRLVSRSGELTKQRLRQLPASAIELYGALFMGPFVLENVIGLGGRVRPPYNVVVSNVPGPQDQLYYAGARLDAIYPLTLIYHGVGLMIAVFAMSGRFNIGFTGDRDSLPHLQRLAVYTGEALEELEKALKESDRRRPKRP